MAKVGNLKLTEEQRKRTFHLPIEQAIIVPSTSGIKTQRKISKAKLNKRVNNVRRFLSNRFGGYTSVKTIGGFVLKDGKLVKERAVKVTAFATRKDFKKNRGEVIKQIGSWGRKWQQESVGFEHEGDLFIIEPPKRGAVKVMRKVISPKRLRKVTVPIKKVGRRFNPMQRKIMLNNLAKARRIKARKR